MRSKLNLTNNILNDIINFLRDDNIVCIHSNGYGIFYYSKEIIENIEDINNNKKMIYIDVSKTPSLLNEDEWPWYIENEKFTRYLSTSILPSNKDNIYNFSL